MLVFGGTIDNDNAEEAYEFDSNKFIWAKMKQTGDVPKPRDDHALCKIDDQSFVIFGGYVEGQRVNECYVGTKNGQTLNWTRVGAESKDMPCIRASHSMAHYQGKCYIFGGQDEDYNKLDDLWELDLSTYEFTMIPLPAGDAPLGRSGHSADVYNGKMYIFGGILELTKELNEMIAYNF